MDLIPGSDTMDYDENVSTLKFAQRVRNIRNRPQRVATEPLGLAPEVPEKVRMRRARRRNQSAE